MAKKKAKPLKGEAKAPAYVPVEYPKHIQVPDPAAKVEPKTKTVVVNSEAEEKAARKGGK